jgi:photosystem II stability/assembly factor-like uncharacterized protein
MYCVQGWDLNVSTDGGETWHWRSQARPSGRATVLSFPPHDPGTLFMAGQGLFVSTDSGAHWTERSSGLPGVALDLKISPADSAHLFAEDKSEEIDDLFRSLDAGRSWERLSASGHSLAFGEGGQVVYAADWDSILRSRDDGRTWKRIVVPFVAPDRGVGGVAAHPVRPETVYALYDSGMGENVPAVYISSDGGASWSGTSLTAHLCDARLFIDHGDGEVVYAVGCTAGETWLSKNSGLTWQACGNTGHPDPYSQWRPHSDSRLAVDAHDPSRIIGAMHGAGVMLSTDACSSWRFGNTGLGSLFVNSVAIDPNNSDTLYAGTDGGAYISFDSGKTWGQVNDGLLGATVVYSIAVDKDSHVYAATPYGIFKLEGK